MLPATRDAMTDRSGVDLTILEVREGTPPADGSEPVVWRLPATLSVKTVVDAEKIITLYRRRWKIGEWHRALKTGSKVERLAHVKRERVERALAINAVIAWRIAALTELGRTRPNRPATVALSDIEMAMLADFAKVRKRPGPVNPGEAFTLVATMGGYLNRGNDQPPGDETAWTGHSALSFSA